MSDSKQTFQRRNKPVFEETQRWDTSNAIKATNLLIALFEDILSDQYIRVPHSLSAILWQEDKLKIDMERTFDENDPYIKEEALIAPIEHQTDRFWRRKITRLTYLACQFLLGLLTGKLPIHPQILTKDRAGGGDARHGVFTVRESRLGRRRQPGQRYGRRTDAGARRFGRRRFRVAARSGQACGRALA